VAGLVRESSRASGNTRVHARPYFFVSQGDTAETARGCAEVDELLARPFVLEGHPFEHGGTALDATRRQLHGSADSALRSLLEREQPRA
jgi:hypothetical protein